MNTTRMFALLGSMLAVPGFSSLGSGQERATPEEVVEKVRQAANVLSQSGEAGLAQFNEKNGPWVWKDTYIFVFDCSKGTTAAHPVRADLVGEDARALTGARGKKFFGEFCQAMKNPAGVWVEYWWPKPGQKEASRKISYAVRAGITPYVVGAGLYDDKVSVADLRKLTGGAK